MTDAPDPAIAPADPGVAEAQPKIAVDPNTPMAQAAKAAVVVIVAAAIGGWATKLGVSHDVVEAVGALVFLVLFAGYRAAANYARGKLTVHLAHNAPAVAVVTKA